MELTAAQLSTLQLHDGVGEINIYHHATSCVNSRRLATWSPSGSSWRSLKGSNGITATVSISHRAAAGASSACVHCQHLNELRAFLEQR